LFFHLEQRGPTSGQGATWPAGFLSIDCCVYVKIGNFN